VKVDAGESGQQIANYQAWIARSTEDPPPTLVILSKKRLREYSVVPWISWQDVRHKATQSSSLYWQDLVHYLKEIHMADEYDEPISNVEAATLLDAHSLYRKASRLIWMVADARENLSDDRKRWSELGWPTKLEGVEQEVLRGFGWSGRFAFPLSTPRQPVQIFLGIVQVDESADFREPEAQVAVWVEHPQKRTSLRDELRAQAEAGGLGAHWKRRHQGWWALTAHQPLSSFADHEAAVAWILDRFAELEAAGILAYVSSPNDSESSTGDSSGPTSDDAIAG